VHSIRARALKRKNVSAGLLLFRRSGKGLEVFLAHPGGPFCSGRDSARGSSRRVWWRMVRTVWQRPSASSRRKRASVPRGLSCRWAASARRQASWSTLGRGRGRPIRVGSGATRCVPSGHGAGAVVDLPGGGQVRMVRRAKRPTQDQPGASGADRQVGSRPLREDVELGRRNYNPASIMPPVLRVVRGGGAGEHAGTLVGRG
jgi:hypothetical protein